MKKSMLKKVISASRRIDMVGCFPEETAEILARKCPPEKVHTLVIWTKNPLPMLKHRQLNQQLSKYDQIFLHLTVTGMGKTPLEPRVPSIEENLNHLPEIIRFLGSPARIRFRFDPIVHLITPSGERYSNISLFGEIAPKITALGIHNVSISWMSVYKKVRTRLEKHGYRILPLTSAQQKQDFNFLTSLTSEHNISLHFCSIPGLPISRCIDGELLNKLHPSGEICSTTRAKGQRKLCGCTESWDIGWYHSCLHGCLYCYANPKEDGEN